MRQSCPATLKSYIWVQQALMEFDVELKELEFELEDD